MTDGTTRHYRFCGGTESVIAWMLQYDPGLRLTPMRTKSLLEAERVEPSASSTRIVGGGVVIDSGADQACAILDVSSNR